METRKYPPTNTGTPDHRHDGEGLDVVWVHLCSGRIVEVRPATDVKVTDDAVIVMAGDEVAASFGRHQVYFTCRDGDACPVLD